MVEIENPSAFPRPDVRDAMGCGISEGSPGMALRDWFAGQALAGLCATIDFDGLFSVKDMKLARTAWLIADAMLSEHAKAREPQP